MALVRRGDEVVPQLLGELTDVVASPPFCLGFRCAILYSTLKDEFPPPLSHPKGHNPLPFPEVVLECSRKCSGIIFQLV